MDEPLDLDQLAALIERLAARIEAPNHRLPTIGWSDQSGRPHIEVHNGLYHWATRERGQERERRTSLDLDDLLYWVFRSVTFGMACDWELEHRELGKDCRRLIFARQLELLERLEPRWRDYCEQEIRTTLAKHPYADGDSDPPLSARETGVMKALVDAKDLKHILASIFRRKGGDGEWTRLFEQLEPTVQQGLARAIGPRAGELPVIGGARDGGTWFLLTTERLVWSREGEREELAHDDVSGAKIDPAQARASGRSKPHHDRLAIETKAGETRTIIVEPEAPFVAVWTVLLHIARWNRQRQEASA